MLFLSIYSVLLDNVVVIMSSFEGCLHLSQLVLHSIQLHTYLLSLLLDLADLFLLLSKLMINYQLPFL